jgi:DNA polymerase III alpha subunit (gram-positive type)
MTALVFDIEANGLLDTATEIYVFVGKELNGETIVQYSNIYNITKSILHTLTSYPILIGHNVIGYDIPLLSKLGKLDLEDFYSNHKVIDTLVLSRLLYPDRGGGHSIEAWAERFKMQKVQNEVWDRYDPIMDERCLTDVQITERVYNRLMWEKEQ